MTTRKQLDALCNLYARTINMPHAPQAAPVTIERCGRHTLVTFGRVDANESSSYGTATAAAQAVARIALDVMRETFATMPSDTVADKVPVNLAYEINAAAYAVEAGNMGDALRYMGDALRSFDSWHGLLQQQAVQAERMAEISSFMQACGMSQSAEVEAMHEACALLQQVDTLLCGPSDCTITAEYEAEHEGYCVWCDANRADGLGGCDMSEHGLSAAEAACYAVCYACNVIDAEFNGVFYTTAEAHSVRYPMQSAWELAYCGVAVEALPYLREAVQALELLRAAALCSLCAGGTVAVEHSPQGYAVETALDGITAEGMTAAQCMQCLCSLAHDCGLNLCAGGSACNSYQSLYAAVEAHVLQLAALDPVAAYVESFSAELLEAADLVRNGHSVYDALRFVEP